MKFYLKDYLKEINPNKNILISLNVELTKDKSKIVILDEDTQKNIVKDKYIYILYICVKTLRHERNLKLPIKLDDFTVNDLKDFEKELNYVKKFKISNIITENNIAKTFDVEKC